MATSVDIFKENIWPSCLPFENVANIDCGTFRELNDYFTSEVSSHYSNLSPGTGPQNGSQLQWNSVCAMFTSSDPCCFDSELSRPMFLCNFCNFDADSIFSVFDHVIKEHAFSCKLCNYTCFTKSGMVHHQLIFHENSQTMKGLLASTFIHLNLDRIQERLHDKSENSEDVGSGANSMEDYFTDSSSLRVRVHDIKQEPLDYSEDAACSVHEGKDAGTSGVKSTNLDQVFKRSLSSQSQSELEAPNFNNCSSGEGGTSCKGGHEHFLNFSSAGENAKSAVSEDGKQHDTVPELDNGEEDGHLQSFLSPYSIPSTSKDKVGQFSAYPLLQHILQKEGKREANGEKVDSFVQDTFEESMNNRPSTSSQSKEDKSKIGLPDSDSVDSGENVESTTKDLQVKEEHMIDGDANSRQQNVSSPPFVNVNDKDSANFKLLRTLLLRQSEGETDKPDQTQKPSTVSDQHDESSTSPVHVADMTLEQLLTSDFSRKRTFSQLMGKGKEESSSIVFTCGRCSFESKDRISFTAHLESCTNEKEDATEWSLPGEAKRMKLSQPSGMQEEAGKSTRKVTRQSQLSDLALGQKVAQSQPGKPVGQSSESSLSDDSESHENAEKDSSDAEWQQDHFSSSSRGADSSDEEFLPTKGQRKTVKKNPKGAKQLRHKSKPKNRPSDEGQKSTSHFLSCSHCAFSSKVLASVKNHLVSNHPTLPPMAKVVAHGVPKSMMYFCRGQDNQCTFFSNKVEDIHAHIRLCYKECLGGYLSKIEGKDFTPVLASFAIAAKGGENKEAVYYCMDCDFLSTAFQSISVHRDNCHAHSMIGALHIEKGIREIRMTMRCLSCLHFISVQKWWTHPCRLKKTITRKQDANVLGSVPISNSSVPQSSSSLEHLVKTTSAKPVSLTESDKTDPADVKKEVIFVEEEDSNSAQYNDHRTQEKVAAISQRAVKPIDSSNSLLVKGLTAKNRVNPNQGISSSDATPQNFTNQWDMNAFQKAFTQLNSDSDRRIASIIRKTKPTSEQTGLLQSILTSPLTSSGPIHPQPGSSSNTTAMTLLKGLLHKTAASTGTKSTDSGKAAHQTTSSTSSSLVLPVPSTRLKDRTMSALSTATHSHGSSLMSQSASVPNEIPPLQPAWQRSSASRIQLDTPVLPREIKPEPIDIESLTSAETTPRVAVTPTTSILDTMVGTSVVPSTSLSTARDPDFADQSDQAMYKSLKHTMVGLDSESQPDSFPSTNLLRSLLTKQSKDSNSK